MKPRWIVIHYGMLTGKETGRTYHRWKWWAALMALGINRHGILIKAGIVPVYRADQPSEERT